MANPLLKQHFSIPNKVITFPTGAKVSTFIARGTGRLCPTIQAAHLRFPNARSAADGDDLAVLHHVCVHLLHLDLQSRSHRDEAVGDVVQ